MAAIDVDAEVMRHADDDIERIAHDINRAGGPTAGVISGMPSCTPHMLCVFTNTVRGAPAAIAACTCGRSA